MMIALACIGVMPFLWRWFPRRMGPGEDLASMCGVLISIAFIAFFPIVGLFSRWYHGAYATWISAWMELAAMITWSMAATTRKERALRPAIPVRSTVRLDLTDHAG